MREGFRIQDSGFRDCDEELSNVALGAGFKATAILIPES